MAASKGHSGAGSLVRDAQGVAVHHLAMGWSIYSDHSVVHVTKADQRGLGRPPRLLVSVRVPMGFQHLVGLPSLDASLTLARALVEAIARESDIDRPKAPAPPEGVTGAAVDQLRTDPLPGL